MKIKLDECMDVRPALILANAGHDARTVYAEGLSVEPDTAIYSVCTKARRVLITQDMVFSNPFVFSPLGTEGIIVIRNPSQLLNGNMKQAVAGNARWNRK